MTQRRCVFKRDMLNHDLPSLSLVSIKTKSLVFLNYPILEDDFLMFSWTKKEKKLTFCTLHCTVHTKKMLESVFFDKEVHEFAIFGHCAWPSSLVNS